MYQDDFSGIIGNCDTTIFLGGKDSETNKQVSDDLGDATIVIRNMSHSRGAKGSSSLSFNRSARKLMDPAEIQKMDNSDCIVMVRGLQPFKGHKYDYTKHPNYKYTGDAKKKIDMLSHLTILKKWIMQNIVPLIWKRQQKRVLLMQKD